jgi:hypothetical protein
MLLFLSDYTTEVVPGVVQKCRDEKMRPEAVAAIKEFMLTYSNDLQRRSTICKMEKAKIKE